MIRHSAGQILIMTALTLVVLLGLSALTIDLGMAYAVKAKLNSAVDAASLAAGKAVKTGANDSARRLNATNAANSFFAANFPPGIRGSTNGPPTIVILSDTPSQGAWTITVSASAMAPTFFSSMFNLPITVGASATATVKTLDMMLVLDCSGSLASYPYGPSPAGTFDALKNAAITFLSGFQEGPGGDRIGLVTFASGAVLNDHINTTTTRGFSKSALTAHINNTAAGGATNAEEAMRIAKAELDGIPSDLRSTLRAIVFFSDGAPNVVSGQFKLVSPTTIPTTAIGLYSISFYNGVDNPYLFFPIDQINGTWGCYCAVPPLAGSPYYDPCYNTPTKIAYLPQKDYTGTVALAGVRGLAPSGFPGYPWANTWCNLNKAARNMVESLADAARSEGTGNAAITIYTIGLGADLTSQECDCYGSDPQEYGENILKRLANTKDAINGYNSAQPTGLYVHANTASELNSAFQKIRSAVLRLSQ